VLTVRRRMGFSAVAIDGAKWALALTVLRSRRPVSAPGLPSFPVSYGGAWPAASLTGSHLGRDVDEAIVKSLACSWVALAMALPTVTTVRMVQLCLNSTSRSSRSSGRNATGGPLRDSGINGSASQI